MISFTSQPSSRNWTASQSSSSGWLGGSPWDAEVLGGLDDARAEDLLPEPVDRHAGGQRVLGRRPASGPSRAGPGSPSGSGGRNPGVARPTGSFGLVVLAAVEEEGRLAAWPAPARRAWSGSPRPGPCVLLLGLGQLLYAAGRRSAGSRRPGVLDEVVAELAVCSARSFRATVELGDLLRRPLGTASRRPPPSRPSGGGPRPRAIRKRLARPAGSRCDAGGVPVDGAAVLGEGPAVDQGARRRCPTWAAADLQADPLAGRRQVAHAAAARWCRPCRTRSGSRPSRRGASSRRRATGA